MKSDSMRSQRGEGGLKFLIAILFVGYVGYVAIVNVPTWMAMQNLKHDMDEVARTTAIEGAPVEKIHQRVGSLSGNYGVSQKNFAVKKEGPGVEITLNTVQKVYLLFTTYDWQISHISKGKWM
jgi:hypothetical protein